MSLDPKVIPLLDLRDSANFNVAKTLGDNEDSNASQANTKLFAVDLQSFNQSQAVEEIPVPLSPMTIDDRRQSKIDFETYKTYLPNFYLRSLPLALSRIMPITCNIVALHFLSYYGDARLSAGFGLGNLMYLLFFGMVVVINSEIMGILCTRAFGQEDFMGFRRSAYRGLCFKLALAVLNSFLFYISDKLLIMVGFERELSIIAGKMAVSMIPALFVQA
jgi:MATE family multidrug resistance protein